MAVERLPGAVAPGAGPRQTDCRGVDRLWMERVDGS